MQISEKRWDGAEENVRTSRSLNLQQNKSSLGSYQDVMIVETAKNGSNIQERCSSRRDGTLRSIGDEGSIQDTQRRSTPKRNQLMGEDVVGVDITPIRSDLWGVSLSQEPITDRSNQDHSCRSNSKVPSINSRAQSSLSSAHKLSVTEPRVSSNQNNASQTTCILEDELNTP